MKKALPSTSRSLPIALIRAREGVMTPIREMLAETGLTEQQWRILRVLSENDELDASTLATKAGLLFPSLTRIAKKMRSKGLITQEQDSEDRRRQRIAITRTGKAIIDENEAQAVKIAESFEERLGLQEFELLLDLLASLQKDQS